MSRSISWLAVAGLAGAALVGPGAAGVAASNEAGSPDYVPNSGHTSSSDLTLTMGDATISCDGSSVNSLSGSFTFQGSGHVVVYLAANNGSNATPAGNVQNNELTVDLTGKTSPVAFVLPVTSAFTATSGGVLIVFASDEEDVSTYTSKSNSLNCTESTTTSTSSSTTSTTDSTTSTTDSTTSTTDSTTSTTDSTTSTTDSTTQSTTESTTDSTTSTVSGTESSTSSTTNESSGGEVLGVEGTPKATLPATSTIAATATTGSPDALRFILLGLAVLLASILLLQPKGSSARK
jgi:hypothetical protein